MHSSRRRRRTSAFRTSLSGLITCFVVLVIIVIISGYFYNKFLPELQKPHERVRIVTEKNKQNKPDPCDLIHIVTVCVTHESKLNLYTMLKSLFHYRKNSPIQLYIVVHPKIIYSLQKLFDTWALPAVKVKYYNVEAIDPFDEFANTPNMLRLMLPKLMKFKGLSKIILLSTDIAFYSDVFELWKEFQHFSENQFLGIPTEKYMEEFQKGYADVVLFHLDNLRKYNGPNKIWEIIKERQGLQYDESAQIQVILNYFAKSKFTYVLECSYNAMSDPDESDCIPEYKVVHQDLVGEGPEDFVGVMKEFDGNTVRKHNNDCYLLPKPKDFKKPITDLCSDVPESEIQQKRTLLYFNDYNYYSSESSDVTLISQLSFHQFGLLEQIANRWHGPMSITFYLTDKEFIKCLDLIEESYVLKFRLNIGYHVVFKYGNYYHINYLRNIALNAVKTPYVFSTDIDLLPMDNLYTVLKKHITDFHNMTKKALVVPAFEIRESSDQVPTTKKNLLDMLKQEKVFINQEDTRPEAHAPTDYAKWKDATKPFKVTWKSEYEPYVVIKRSMVTYDERFPANGWDKVSYIMELEAQGYEFYVLQNTFIVHKCHTSEDKNISLTSREYEMCMESIKEVAVKDLKDKYGRTFIID